MSGSVENAGTVEPGTSAASIGTVTLEVAKEIASIPAVKAASDAVTVTLEGRISDLEARVEAFFASHKATIAAVESVAATVESHTGWFAGLRNAMGI